MREIWFQQRRKSILIRLTILVAVVIVATAVFSVIWLPALLVPNGIAPEARSRLINEHRATWAAVFGGVFVIFGGLVAFWRASISLRQVQAYERGQVTERFTRAIDQLGRLREADGSNNVVVRLGGIAALEQIARDSRVEYYWPIVAVLTAYVREASPRSPSLMRLSEDVQAALTVSLRMLRSPPPGSSLAKADFAGSYLVDAQLSETSLYAVEFQSAVLIAASFKGSELRVVDFTRCALFKVDFSGATFEEVEFVDSNLQCADFRFAKFLPSMIATEDDHIELPAANFRGANLTEANFSGVNLRHTEGLSRDQLLSAMFDDRTVFPGGQKGLSAHELSLWTAEDCQAAGLEV